MPRENHVTGVERFFGDDDLIVSKTDLKGIITYANRTFLDISGYVEGEVLGRPHNLIRHPNMPRCIFQMLWQTLEAGREVFAYVMNRCKSGDHYWVFAHVTPSFDARQQVVGYHSNRRAPERAVVEGAIIPLYRRLLEVERQAPDSRTGLQASAGMLRAMLEEKGVSYDQFIFAL